MLVKSSICIKAYYRQAGGRKSQHLIRASLNRGAWALPSSALGNRQRDHTHATRLPPPIPSHLLLAFQLQHKSWSYWHTSIRWRGWTALQLLVSISLNRWPLHPEHPVPISTSHWPWSATTCCGTFPLCTQAALYVSSCNFGTRSWHHKKQNVTLPMVLFQGDISLSPAEDKPAGCRTPTNTWKTAP